MEEFGLHTVARGFGDRKPELGSGCTETVEAVVGKRRFEIQGPAAWMAAQYLRMLLEQVHRQVHDLDGFVGRLRLSKHLLLEIPNWQGETSNPIEPGRKSADG
jgi:hypothetical protein